MGLFGQLTKTGQAHAYFGLMFVRGIIRFER
jgi:hypothetical protein